MANEQRIGIRMTVDAASAYTELPRAAQQFEKLGASAEDAARRGTRSLDQIGVSVRDVITGAAGLSIVVSAVHAVTDALTALPKAGLDFTSQVEVAQTGMAGVLGSMTAINGRQTSWNQGLAIAGDMIAKLNDDALRTAATSQELVGVFQALLAPGLAANMTLDQIRQLSVVGTNAVKSIGLSGAQVVQELRDLVAGGITAAGSQLATALGLRDEDIAKARGSAEGLFAFLMSRLKGFQQASDDFGKTLSGAISSLQEGATRVAAEGMTPLTQAIHQAVDGMNSLLVTQDKFGNSQLNPQIVAELQGYAAAAVNALTTGRDVATQIYAHRDAVVALAVAYASVRLGQWSAAVVDAARVQLAQVEATRLARVEAAAKNAVDQEAVLTSRQKVAALLGELQAQAAVSEAQAADAAARVARLQLTVQAIELSRAEVVGQMAAARATMAQAEAQVQAARSAGALSFAIALRNEGLATLNVTQARHAALMSELATLGQQQARVTLQITAATAAQTAATTAATVASGRLAQAQTAASATAGLAAASMRGFGVVVGALGGPVGIAIAVITSLALAIYQATSAADEAAKRRMQAQRAVSDAASGKTPDYRDTAALMAQLDDFKNRRDELLASGKQAPRSMSLATLNNGIADLEQQLAKVQAASQRAGQTNTEVALTVEGARQAWMKANAEVKSASNIQDEYAQKLAASRNAYAQYAKQLQATNGSPKALADAAARQAQNEKALATERDKALQGLGATATKVASATTKLDLEGIRAQASATESALTGAQKILEAQHAAGLVEDQAYYGQRLQLMQQMAAAQVAELQAENDRLSADKLSGQEAIDRDRQVAENKRKMAALQAEADTQAKVMAYEAKTAIDAHKTALVAARQAAQDYYDTQQQQQNRDLAAVGQGSRQRSLNSGLAQIEDRYAQQRRDLENNKAQADLSDKWTAQQEEEYQKRLALIREFQVKAVDSYRDYYDQLGVLQSDWRNGANEALRDYADQAADVAGGTKQAFGNALGGVEDYFVALASKGKASFGDLVTSVVADIARIEARLAISSAANYLVGAFGGSTIKGYSGDSSSPMFVGPPAASAKGNAFVNSPGLSAYSGSIVDKPTFFAKGGNVMGEAGPEGIFPLRRNSQGVLGVVAMGAQQQQSPRVEIHNYMGNDAQASVSQGPDGRTVVEFERRVLATVSGDMAAGGSTARASAARFGQNNGATLRRRRG